MDEAHSPSLEETLPNTLPVPRKQLSGPVHTLTHTVSMCMCVYSAFRKYSHPFIHMLLCYSLNLKLIQCRCFVTGQHTTPHNVKVELCFSKWLQMN